MQQTLYFTMKILFQNKIYEHVFHLQSHQDDQEVYLLGDTKCVCVPDQESRTYGVLGMRFNPLSHLACLTCPHCPTECSHVEYFNSLTITEDMAQEIRDLASKHGLSKSAVGVNSRSSEMRPKSWKPIPPELPSTLRAQFREGQSSLNKDQDGFVTLYAGGVCTACHTTTSSAQTAEIVMSPVSLILNTQVLQAKGLYANNGATYCANNIDTMYRRKEVMSSVHLYI